MSTTVIEYDKSGLAGVTKTLKTEGSGAKPKPGETVTVTYSGYLEDGQVQVSGNKKEIKVGKRDLWGTGGDLGLLSMKPGERAIFKCEHDFAGPQGADSPVMNLDMTLHSVVGDGTEAFTPGEWKMIKILLVAMALIMFCFLWKEGFFHDPLHITHHINFHALHCERQKLMGVDDPHCKDME